MNAKQTESSLMDGDPATAMSASLRAAVGDDQQRPCRVLVLSTPFPSTADPTRGIFVRERIKALAALPGIEIRVVSPTAWVPPLEMFRRLRPWARHPQQAVDGRMDVFWPRYPLVPKLGSYFRPQLMYWSVKKTVDRIRRHFDFDLIDAHFVYPSGVLGSMLGHRYRRPVVITGRGEDILRFPNLPILARMIRRTVSRPHRFVALSEEIANAFASCGAARERIYVIPNGVDADRFAAIPQAEARATLNLPPQRPIIVSVGDLQERKGFHILVDAVARIRARFPELRVYIAGGRAPYGKDYGSFIKSRISELGLEDCVELVGRVPHEKLSLWYSAADLFTLLSSREGSPNVLLEALACGCPAVATSIGGIPEELADRDLGILLPERTADAAANGLSQALERNWNREGIRQKMECRTWSATAKKFFQVFQDVLSFDRPTISE